MKNADPVWFGAKSELEVPQCSPRHDWFIAMTFLARLPAV